MAFTRYQILLSVVMVVTGSINTLSTKWADHLEAKGSDGKVRKFDHPFVQACVMFLGEILCLLAFKICFVYYTRLQTVIDDVDIIRGSQNFNPLIFFPPAIFDMISTSLMYIGLNMTTASSFQMLRGSVIVFVAILSSVFVGRNITRKHGSGITFIILGLITVGLSDLSSKDERDTNSVITGDLLIIIAQGITACQMVYEEKYVVDKDIPPLQAVGWEGTFGFVVLGALLYPFYYIHVSYPFADNAHKVLEDLPDALAQMGSNYWIVVSVLGTMISIAFFNFAGISMTKEISATTRMVLDSVRTFFIWIFSIFVHWQEFHYLQLFGFLILLFGMMIYYDLLSDVVVPLRLRGNPPEQEPIVNQRADEA